MFTSTPQSAGTPTLQDPTPAGRETGGTSRPNAAVQDPAPVGLLPAANGGRETGAAPRPLPWQRLDAAWPILPESLMNGLDGFAQRLVRRCLTEAVGDRLRLLRSLGLESQRIWEPRPHLAQYVRQRRFLETLLPRWGLAECQRLLYTEIMLTVEVLETPPSRLGIEEWLALLELQCKRIAQIYVQLRARIGAQAQQEVERAFKLLPGRKARV